VSPSVVSLPVVSLVVVSLVVEALVVPWLVEVAPEVELDVGPVPELEDV